MRLGEANPGCAGGAQVPKVARSVRADRFDARYTTLKKAILR
jgi:hypothetical protein